MSDSTGESVHLDAPGSKSHTTRALVLSFLSGDRTEIHGGSRCTDAVVLSEALEALRAGASTIDASDGGAPGRFLLSVSAATGACCVLNGSERLRKRPFGPLINALRALGATIECQSEEGYLPLKIEGAATGVSVSVDSSQSSQFASALLLVAPVLPSGLELTATTPVSDGYMDLTVNVLREFGATVAESKLGSDRLFRVGGGLHPPTAFLVPQDVSGAAFLWLAGVLGTNPVTVPVARNGDHPDLQFLDCLEAMGATIIEADGSTTVGGELTRGGRFDLSGFPDSACALAVAAIVCGETVQVRGASHLRLKESDRCATMVEGARRLGVLARATDDGFVITGGTPLMNDVVLDAHEDHRVAMAFAALGTRHAVTIRGVDCVGKSFPEYFHVLNKVAHVEELGVKQ